MEKQPSGLYPWLRKSYLQLANSRSQWHHALLISSPSGLGKYQLVARLVEMLQCAQPVPNQAGIKACGTCQQCLLHSSMTHPDHVIIEPIEGKSQIAIDQIRAIAGKVLNKGLISPYRVVQINQAQLMTESAANALLKLLEEPPANVYFILISDAAHQLPATVLSRCLSHIIALPSQKNTLTWLNKDPSITVSNLQLQLAKGSPLRAKKLAHDNAFNDIQHLIKSYGNLVLQAQQTGQTFELATIDFIALLKNNEKSVSLNEMIDLMLWLHVVCLKHHHGVGDEELVLALFGQNVDGKLNQEFVLYCDHGLKALKPQLINNNGLNTLLQLQQLIVNWNQHA